MKTACSVDTGHILVVIRTFFPVIGNDGVSEAFQGVYDHSGVIVPYVASQLEHDNALHYRQIDHLDSIRVGRRIRPIEKCKREKIFDDNILSLRGCCCSNDLYFGRYNKLLS